MKRIFLLIVLLLLSVCPWCRPAIADRYNAIIYCNGRGPAVAGEVREHWKPEVPDVGVDELVRDFKVLAKQNDKILVHALVEADAGPDSQVNRIKGHIRALNGCQAPALQGPSCQTPVGSQVLAWWHREAAGAYLALWNDRQIHPVFETIARGTLRYAVIDVCEEGPCTVIVSVAEAEDVFGELIEDDKLIIPHKFYGK